MAEEQQDNFWLYIGGIIVATIILVVMLKGRETAHLKSGAVAELQKETFQSIEERKKLKNRLGGCPEGPPCPSSEGEKQK